MWERAVHRLFLVILPVLHGRCCLWLGSYQGLASHLMTICNGHTGICSAALELASPCKVLELPAEHRSGKQKVIDERHMMLSKSIKLSSMRTRNRLAKGCTPSMLREKRLQKILSPQIGSIIKDCLGGIVSKDDAAAILPVVHHYNFSTALDIKIIKELLFTFRPFVIVL